MHTALGPRQIRLSGLESWLPADHLVVGSRSIIVVAERRFSNHAAQVGRDGQGRVDAGGLLLLLGIGLLQELVLLGVDLQAIGLRILSVVQEIGQRQKDARQDLFVVLSRVGQTLVVRQHAEARFQRVGLLQFIEVVPHATQRPLRLVRFSTHQLDHGQVQGRGVRIARIALDVLGERFGGRFQVARVELRVSQANPIGIRGTTGRHQAAQQAESQRETR